LIASILQGSSHRQCVSHEGAIFSEDTLFISLQTRKWL
jgi:hypothetical protein